MSWQNSRFQVGDEVLLEGVGEEGPAVARLDVVVALHRLLDDGDAVHAQPLFHVVLEDQAVAGGPLLPQGQALLGGVQVLWIGGQAQLQDCLHTVLAQLDARVTRQSAKTSMKNDLSLNRIRE